MKAKICQSRKNMHSVMNHTGFGSLVIVHRGVQIFVPNSFMFSDGKLKAYAIKYVNLEIEKINTFMEENKNIC